MDLNELSSNSNNNNNKNKLITHFSLKLQQMNSIPIQMKSNQSDPNQMNSTRTQMNNK